MRIPLDGHEILDLDGAFLTNTAKVIPPKVHQHHMFGDLFRIGQQFLFQGSILLRRLAARTGPRDRPCFNKPLLATDQQFGRRPYNGKVVDIQQVHVRRRIQRP